MSNELTTVSGITGDLVSALTGNGIESLLPKHIKVDVFARLAAVAIFNNPLLLEADRQSVVNSLIMSAKDGLVCDGREAALVPFKTNVNGRFISKAQYMPMVDGVLKRVRQSGQVTLIASKAVFANDEFDFWSDEDGDHFKHKPTLGEPGELVAVIAYAKMKDGTRHIELLRKWEIDRSRGASKQGNNDYGPWAKYYDRMACKTGLHRVARRLPNSTEILEMLERGDPKSFDDAQKERDVTPEPKLGGIDALMSEKVVEREIVGFETLDQILASSDDLNELKLAAVDIADSLDNGDISDKEAATLRQNYIKKSKVIKQKEIDVADFEAVLESEEKMDFSD